MGNDPMLKAQGEKSMKNGLLILIVVGISSAAVIGAAYAVFFMNSDDESEKMFAVTYYSGGNKVHEITVPEGTSVTVAGNIGGNGSSAKFAGWNTRPDLTGPTIAPGSVLKADGNIRLYAMVAGSGVFMIVLPEKQDGFSMTADPLLVVSGGSSILSYSILPSHIDNDLSITVNGNPMSLDAMKRIYLANITEDQTVEVTGVFDRREHNIFLPAEQIGYTMTSSAERVHHGQPYVLQYALLPGYRESNDFGIHVNGGSAKMPSGGILLIESVMADHEITVTGVEPIPYGISSGSNISILVNGIAADTATVEDLITVLPDEGYAIPETFGNQIKGRFTIEGEGYRTAGDIVFPSVLKITAGDNTLLNSSQKTIFVCPGDRVAVSPSSGYSMPEDYADKARELSGAAYSAGRFSFSDDVVLPSVYKVVFNGHNKVHATLYAVGGSDCPIPTNNPLRSNYHFDRWHMDSKPILDNKSIDAIWSPDEYAVTFGNNLVYSINGKYYSQPGSYTVTVEDLITISVPLGYELPAAYLPLDVFVKKGTGYSIISDYSLPSIHFVQYEDIPTNMSKRWFYAHSEMHYIEYPESPLFPLNLDGTGLDINDFMGWIYNGRLYCGEAIFVNEDIMLNSLWRTS